MVSRNDAVAIVTCGLPQIPAFQKYPKNHVPMHICICKFALFLVYTYVSVVKRREKLEGGGFMAWMI